jgi:alkylation response protein AidB-like acyl-CoA dehydrogenase
MPANVAPTTRTVASPDEEAQVLETVERWVEKQVRPIARKFDQADEYPADLVGQMQELGLFGATIGQEWGGLGLSASTYARIVTTIARAWMAPSVMAPTSRSGTFCPGSRAASCAAASDSRSPMRVPTCRASAWSRSATATTTC